MNSTNSKSTKRSLKPSKRHPTVSENSKSKPSNCTRLVTTSSSRRSSPTLKTSSYFSTHTPSMTYADTGKSFRKSHLIQSLSTTRPLKGLKCTTIPTQTTCSESLPKFPDSSRNSLIFKLTTLPNSDIQRSSETWANLKTLVLWEN